MCLNAHNPNVCGITQCKSNQDNTNNSDRYLSTHIKCNYPPYILLIRDRVGLFSCHHTVYPKKYAHGFVVLCFVVVMQSFIMNSHEVFIHIHQGCFAGTGAIVRLPQCQWSKPDGYGKISQCITTTKHSKAKTVCIFLGIYCIWRFMTRVLISTVHPSNKRKKHAPPTRNPCRESRFWCWQSFNLIFPSWALTGVTAWRLS